MAKLGSNLGTLNQMGYGYGFGTDATDTFNKYLAKQIVEKGSDMDKLLYMIGGAVGNAMRVNREGRENKKLDKIIEEAKNGGTDTSASIGASGMTPEQDQAYQKQIADLAAMGAAPSGDGAISVGVNQNAGSVSPIDAALDKLQAQPSQATAPANNGLNNYYWDYINKKAREADISQRILASRKADIEKDIASQADAMYLPEIQKNLYGYKDADGNYVQPTVDTRLKAMEQLAELKKYSPESAKAYETLAVNGMQGDVNFAQKKELQQMQLDAASAKQQRAIDAAYNKQVQSLQNKLAYDSLKKGRQLSPKERIELQEKYAALGEELQAKYGKNNLPKSDEKVRMYFEWRDILYPDTKTQENPNGSVANPGGGSPASPSGKQPSMIDVITNIVKSTDFSNYGDDAGKGKYNFLTGTQAIVDTMRKAGQKDDDIYTTVDSILAKAEKQDELPPGYREQFAHSMNRKTQKEITDEAIKKKEEEALKLDMKLNPQKYGIDPFAGVKETGSAIGNGKPIWNIAHP